MQGLGKELCWGADPSREACWISDPSLISSLTSQGNQKKKWAINRRDQVTPRVLFSPSPLSPPDSARLPLTVPDSLPYSGLGQSQLDQGFPGCGGIAFPALLCSRQGLPRPEL